MRTIKAFTLIELLVVIAIIALLLAILLPSLGLAKDHAKKIHCSANLKSLAMAVLFYADENDSYTPSASNRWTDNNNNIRAGWCGRTSDIATRLPLPLDEQIKGNSAMPGTGLENGQLWPYIETTGAWRCPADPSKDELRSYGMSAEWWSAHTTNDNAAKYDSPATRGMVYRKINKITGSGRRFLFVDQAGYNVDAHAAIWYSRPMWWNIPNYFHNGGSVNGFADGHVESYKFEQETAKIARQQYEYYQSQNNEGWYKMPENEYPDSDDLRYYQQATWGSIGW